MCIFIHFKIFKEKPGVISDGPVWICFDFAGPWMYEHETLPGLLWKVIREWRNERHLIGY